MKKYGVVLGLTALFSLAALGQTSANGAASASVSSSPRQSGATLGASQSAQTGPASASAGTNASAQTSLAKHNSPGKNSKGGSSANGNSSGSASLPAGDASAVLTSGTTLQAVLTKSVDAKKAKPGDEVNARLTQDVKANGKVVLHKGSKLVGHVTQAQAHTKQNAESTLGIVFDKALLKGGQEMSFNGVIQALAPPVSSALMAEGDEGMDLSAPMGGGGGVRSGGGALGGVTGAATSTLGSAAGATTGAVGGTLGAAANGASGSLNVNGAAGLGEHGVLLPASHGIVGLQGLMLNSAASGAAQGSLITSSTRTVKLNSGTQMLLNVSGAAK